MRPSGALDFTGLSVNVLADQCNALMCALLFFWTFGLSSFTDSLKRILSQVQLYLFM